MGHYDEHLEEYYDSANKFRNQNMNSVTVSKTVKSTIDSKLGSSSNIEYKFSEDRLIPEIIEYVNKTYNQHYAQNKYQATEFIIDCGHGIGFAIGDILKYAQRYGHKGTPDDWRKDLMKIIHYAIIALHVHDKNHSEETK
jgi:hypothetical protein